MFHFLATFCIVLLTPTAMIGPDDFPTDLEKWIEVGPPGPYSDQWYVANHDKHEWVVTLRDGRPRADLRDRKADAPAALPFRIEPGSAGEGLYGRRSSIEVSDGWIVGFNAGEFGAGIWWFSPDGKDRYKISEEWVRGFIPTEVGLLAPEGLAHKGLSKGRLIRLTRGPGGRWQSEDFVDLGRPPEVAVKAADGSLIVATTGRLLRVVPASKKVEVLVDGAFWGGLYPNSLVTAPTGTIYLGMRHGVAKVEKEGESYRLRWLLPNKEFVDMKPQEGSR